MTFTLQDEAGELITPELERKSFSTWTCKTDGKVITGGIHDCAVDGHDNTLIAEALTAFDKTGLNTMVVREYSLVIGPPPPDGIHRKRVGVNVTLKQRMDDAPPGPRRNVPNTGAVTLSAHPELRAEFIVEAMPNTLYGPAVKIANNPGATLGEVSADMLAGGGLPFTVDGKPVGVPFFTDIWRPPFIVTQTDDGVTRVYIRDYGHRQEGLRDGTGCFLIFQTLNDAGEWTDSAQLNGGLIDRRKGRLQGCLDIPWLVDDKVNGVAGVPNMTDSGGPPAGFVPLVDSSLNLGNIDNRWLTAFVTALDMPVETKRLLIDGKPTTCQCVRVGDRWMRVHEEAP